MLPGWFTGNDQPWAGPDLRPALQPLQVSIPEALLTVNVLGPSVASLGSPLGAGEVYTAVIRNNSASIAYGIFLTATYPSFFIYDGGSQLISRTGTIAVYTATGASEHHLDACHDV